MKSIYREQSNRIFETFNAATDLDLQITALELELEISSTFTQAMEPPGNPMSEEEIRSRPLKMRAFLQSLCEDLLETHDNFDRN